MCLAAPDFVERRGTTERFPVRSILGKWYWMLNESFQQYWSIIIIAIIMRIKILHFIHILRNKKLPTTGLTALGATWPMTVQSKLWSRRIGARWLRSYYWRHENCGRAPITITSYLHAQIHIKENDYECIRACAQTNNAAANNCKTCVAPKENRTLPKL